MFSQISKSLNFFSRSLPIQVEVVVYLVLIMRFILSYITSYAMITIMRAHIEKKTKITSVPSFLEAYRPSPCCYICLTENQGEMNLLIITVALFQRN